jgi:hypothetical protein
MAAQCRFLAARQVKDSYKISPIGAERLCGLSYRRRLIFVGLNLLAAPALPQYNPI